MPKKKKTPNKNIIVGIFALIVLVIVGAIFSLSKQSFHPKKTVMSSPKIEDPIQVVTWQDALECSKKGSISRVGWKKYRDTEHGISFEYPQKWSTSKQSSIFSEKDIVAVRFSTTNNQPYKGAGGGGSQTNGATMNIGTPIRSHAPNLDPITLDEWIERKLNQPSRHSFNSVFETQKDISVGTQKGIGITCATNCNNQIFVLNKDMIWRFSFTLRHDYDNSSPEKYPEELCGILDSIQFPQ